MATSPLLLRDVRPGGGETGWLVWDEAIRSLPPRGLFPKEQGGSTFITLFSGSGTPLWQE